MPHAHAVEFPAQCGKIAPGTSSAVLRDRDRSRRESLLGQAANAQTSLSN
jgi:hypothetical protein